MYDLWNQKEHKKRCIFFYKERKRMQRTPRSFIKNRKERKNAAFFWKECMPISQPWSLVRFDSQYSLPSLRPSSFRNLSFILLLKSPSSNFFFSSASSLVFFFFNHYTVYLHFETLLTKIKSSLSFLIPPFHSESLLYKYIIYSSLSL